MGWMYTDCSKQIGWILVRKVERWRGGRVELWAETRREGDVGVVGEVLRGGEGGERWRLVRWVRGVWARKERWCGRDFGWYRGSIESVLGCIDGCAGV